MKFILEKKIEMSQIFDEKGNTVPVTLIEAGPCFVTQIKTKDKELISNIKISVIDFILFLNLILCITSNLLVYFEKAFFW